MNVFILNTGRCGSTTIIRACQHITNFSAAHESRSTFLASERLNYPAQHIEGDNRLVWFLGQLDERYGNDAFYVHLVREREATVASYARRWGNKLTIVQAFGESILLRRGNQLSDVEQLQISADYYDAANANIELFLKDKTQKMRIDLENIQTDFQQFWKKIGAQGSLDAALQTLSERFNSTETPTQNRMAEVPQQQQSSWWQQLQLRWAYKQAIYWTSFYFRKNRR
jgi:hypothetical protein